MDLNWMSRSEWLAFQILPWSGRHAKRLGVLFSTLSHTLVKTESLPKVACGGRAWDVIKQVFVFLKSPGEHGPNGSIASIHRNRIINCPDVPRPYFWTLKRAIVDPIPLEPTVIVSKFLILLNQTSLWFSNLPSQSRCPSPPRINGTEEDTLWRPELVTLVGRAAFQVPFSREG